MILDIETLLQEGEISEVAPSISAPALLVPVPTHTVPKIVITDTDGMVHLAVVGDQGIIYLEHDGKTCNDTFFITSKR